MTEAELNTHVRTMIAMRHLFGYHVRNSIGSSSGWPDWVIVGPRGILFRELKSENGQCSREQRMVADKLRGAGQDWDVWRPSDLMSGIIAKELEGIR